MRFALSAAAAASGVVLFAAALFGQPEVYLRHARQQWSEWIDFEPNGSVAEQDETQKAAALVARVQALQDEVYRLKDQLAAKQAVAEMAPVVPSVPNPAARLSPAAQGVAAPSDASVTAPVTIPERRVVAVPGERREAAGKQAAMTPSRSSPVRPEPDNTRSVLARLRQAPLAPAQVTDPSQERPKPVVLPVMSRMTAAQAAINGGRIEDGRRLLQEAQLLVVFRPPGSGNEDMPASGRGSLAIAHALEALGNNDIARCRLFMERAVDDMTGVGTDAPEREALGRRTGYAPAYPPRQ